jgi:hypothetical protein
VALSQEDATFEGTLDRLEAEREAVEIEYRSKLTVLEECVGRLAAATDEVGRAVQARDDARAAIARRARKRLGDGVISGDGTAGDLSPWPAAGGPLRRLINGLMRRLMRDYLEVVDRRTDRLNERLDLLDGLFGDLLEASGGHVEDAGSETGGKLSTAGAAHAAFERAAESLAAAADVHRHAHRVVNAKDAELLQRAAAGPLRRMELVFDEFARQQEALLARLIGRKQELDALIVELRGEERET